MSKCIRLLGVTVLLYAVAAVAAAPVEVTYVANEGFLVSVGDKKILLDAIYAEGVEGYAKLAASDRVRVEAAEPPFDDVDLILATHFHPDHFDPVAVGRYMVANTRAELLTTPGAVALMREKFDRFKDIQSRVHATAPAEGSRERFRLAGIDVEALNVHHGRRFAKDVENIGFIISLGGRRLLHLGDSAGDEKDFRRNRINESHFDVAFVPYWYLSTEELIPAGRLIDAEYIVAMHLPVASSAGGRTVTREVLGHFPAATFFERPFEHKTFFSRNSQ